MVERAVNRAEQEGTHKSGHLCILSIAAGAQAATTRPRTRGVGRIRWAA